MPGAARGGAAWAPADLETRADSTTLNPFSAGSIPDHANRSWSGLFFGVVGDRRAPGSREAREVCSRVPRERDVASGSRAGTNRRAAGYFGIGSRIPLGKKLPPG